MKLFPSILFSFFIFLISSNTYGQAPHIKWARSLGGYYSEKGYAISKTYDGGFIVAGSTNSMNADVTGFHGSSSSYSDAWVVKLDSKGQVKWKKAYGGTDNDVAYSIQQTYDSGYIIAGYSGSTDGDLTFNHGGKDAWLIKIDSVGNISWQKSYGGSNDDIAISVLQTADSNYVFAGASMSGDGDCALNYLDISGHPTNDFWIMKVNSTGNKLWQRNYGGQKEDIGRSIIQTMEGGYMVVGETNSYDFNVIGNHGGYDYWVLKLNPAGDTVWKKCYGGAGNEEAESVIQTADSGFVVGGMTDMNSGDVSGDHSNTNDGWVLRLDKVGNITWGKALGGSNSDAVYSVIEANDGEFMATGVTSSTDGDVTHSIGSSDLWVVKLTAGGSINWQKTYGGTNDDVGRQLIQVSDSDFGVVGYSLSNDSNVTGNHGDNDIWVAKLTLRTDTTGDTTNFVTTKFLNEDIKVYPTLTKGSVNVVLPQGFENTELRIINLLGKEIQTNNEKSLRRTVSLTDDPPGLYILQIINSFGVESFKVTYSQ